MCEISYLHGDHTDKICLFYKIELIFILQCEIQQNLVVRVPQLCFSYYSIPNLSTKKATYSLTNNIHMAWNKKIHIGRIFCDLTKAFNCVNHDLLMAKLEHYGIQLEYNWLKSYLIGRKQRVKFITLLGKL